MPTISRDAQLQTVITTFEVNPGTCHDLLDELRDAYVKEFMARSKRRPRADADALLRMTLATGQEKSEGGTVVLTTHPEFGGNVFHFREVDGVWFIVRIDQ